MKLMQKFFLFIIFTLWAHGVEFHHIKDLSGNFYTIDFDQDETIDKVIKKILDASGIAEDNLSTILIEGPKVFLDQNILKWNREKTLAEYGLTNKEIIAHALYLLRKVQAPLTFILQVRGIRQDMGSILGFIFPKQQLWHS